MERKDSERLMSLGNCRRLTVRFLGGLPDDLQLHILHIWHTMYSIVYYLSISISLHTYAYVGLRSMTSGLARDWVYVIVVMQRRSIFCRMSMLNWKGKQWREIAKAASGVDLPNNFRNCSNEPVVEYGEDCSVYLPRQNYSHVEDSSAQLLHT